MFDTQDFQPTDATLLHIGCTSTQKTLPPVDIAELQPKDASLSNSDSPGAIDATVDQPLQFPCTLKQVADELGVNYNTLRNKWIKSIEGIYKGYDTNLRNERKLVTAFGFSAIQSYVDHVASGNISFEEHAENERRIHNIIQAQYVENIDKAENDPGIDQIDHDELAQQTYTNPLDELMNWTPPVTAKSEIVHSAKAELAPPQTTLDVQSRTSELSVQRQQLSSELAKLVEFVRKENELYRQRLSEETEESKRKLAELEITQVALETELQLAKESEIRANVRNREVEEVTKKVASNVIDCRNFFAQRSGKSG